MKCSCFGILLATLAACGTLGAEPAEAATWRVTTTADDNGPCLPADCTLREALLAANASPEADLIEVPGGVHRITLPFDDRTSPGPTGGLAIEGGEVEIRGLPGEKVILDGGGIDSVLFIYQADVKLVDLEIRGARGFLQGGLSLGFGMLEMLRCTVAGNESFGGFGGGLRVLYGSVTIEDSAIVGNTALRGGGGIFFQGIDDQHLLRVVNSTLSGNHALNGGAIGADGGGHIEILHTTIADNVATNFPEGGGIFNRIGGTVSIGNSLIADSCLYFAGAPVAASGGGNLESPGATCFVPAAGDRVGIGDPLLAPLADNGGPTPTRALQYGSPAIDAADPGQCTAADQRGVARPQGAGCDSGAYELAGPIAADVPATGAVGIPLLAALLAIGGCRLLRFRL